MNLTVILAYEFMGDSNKIKKEQDKKEEEEEEGKEEKGEEGRKERGC